MGTVLIGSGRKRESEVVGPSGRGSKEDESAKLERDM
jgi:hypothetical protein